MPLDKDENKERMKNTRAAQKEEERNAIIDGIVAKLGDKLPELFLTMMSEQSLHKAPQRKMSCLEEYLSPPRTPPNATRIGGTRGRSPAVGAQE